MNQMDDFQIDTHPDKANQKTESISLPAITLPGSGGGSNGIDEKLSINAVTGTSHLSLALPFSGCRNNFQPSLRLSYDSGFGNSAFGCGWNIDLPMIKRKTQNELPRYRDGLESDTFVISGAEDLVTVLKKNAAEERWEPWREDRRENGVDYRVTLYRPRIEGTFARIEKWQNLGSGDIHWRSISPQNVTTVYGAEPGSRLADPVNPRHVFAWLISYSYDDKGNCIRYHYKPEDLAGVDAGTPAEINRLKGLAPVTNLYLKSVQYGNQTPYHYGDSAFPEFHFETVFDYGEHDPARPAPAETKVWELRSDPFSRYTAGFEIRTYRLCRRVLLFHTFAELGPEPCLIRAFEFTYAYQTAFHFLTQIVQKGYKRQPDGTYSSRALPPFQLNYQQPEWSFTLQTLSPGSAANLPVGLDTKQYRWVDLRGEGIAGIFSEQGNGWYYKANLGKGEFAPQQMVAPKPNSNGFIDNRLALQNLESAGQPCIVEFGKTSLRYYEVKTEGAADEDCFAPPQNYPEFSLIDFTDPNLRLVDLNGDGLADLLISREDVFLMYAYRGKQGYQEAEEVIKEASEDHGPRVVFAAEKESLFLADMNGDGLVDIVRVRNGEVAYWPNLGYGRFGAKVAMDHAPYFAAPAAFDPKLVRVTDIDGSGTADLVYLENTQVSCWLNRNGNGFAPEPLVIPVCPRPDSVSHVHVIDFLGTGTSCLVWSTPLQAQSGQALQYIDILNSKKPYLLKGFTNNMGREVIFHYLPSTHYYLEDKKSGTPWATRLPFPVQCVARVERLDHVTGTRFTTHYRYRHGYYDTAEKEFRGFGRVDQTDTEEFRHYVMSGAANVVEKPLYQPPVLTKTWFHTGAFLQKETLHQVYRQEYYQNTAFPEKEFAGTVVPAPLAVTELVEAWRACKGVPLRQEIYALDESADALHPYLVTENQYQVRLIQPRQTQKHAVFLPLQKASIQYHYERNPGDPRVKESFFLAYDAYGNLEQSVAVNYRRRSIAADLPAVVKELQNITHIVYTETHYTNAIDRHTPSPVLRLPRPFRNSAYEITGLAPAAGLYFSFKQLAAAVGAATELAFEDEPDGSLQKRLLHRSETEFLADDATTPLAVGVQDSLGLVYQKYRLVFTPGLVGKIYGSRVSDPMLSAHGYVQRQGKPDWWLPGGTLLYPADPGSRFYLPRGSRDALGQEATVEYDSYFLIPKQTTDALGNSVTAEIDYRTLAPRLITDPNQNRTAVETDELGVTVKSALMGKAGAAEGDTLDDPTSRAEYDFFQWLTEHKPNFIRVFAREKHGAANPRWQEQYQYFDGAGNNIMIKVQAEPGPARQLTASGGVVEIDTSPAVRWVGNGRTVFNNKGHPVKQFEPYFSVTAAYEDARELVETGVTPLFYYDPLGRLLRTEYPDGTVARVAFDPWKKEVYDNNDTVLESRWYQDRGSPAPGGLEPGDPEIRAAWLTVQHAHTPGVAWLDSLGREFYSLADNGTEKFALVKKTDITTTSLQLIDPKGRVTAHALANMVRITGYTSSTEKGETRILTNAVGKPVQIWDNDTRVYRMAYDSLHRPTLTFLTEHSGAEKLVAHNVYGESHPEASRFNLKGNLYQVYDQAQQSTTHEFDFKGNPLRIEQKLTKSYKAVIDWQVLSGAGSVAEKNALAAPLLETESYTSVTGFDAMNRPLFFRLPDDTVITPLYNEGNHLEALKARLRGAGTEIFFLTEQDFDAKGQRLSATFGNNTRMRCTYAHDNFRLQRQLTQRLTDNATLQDIRYTYDPVGNITQVVDEAQQTLFFNNSVVKPENRFVYDALYQLISATGREHSGPLNSTPRDHRQLPFLALPHPNDSGAVRNYKETYRYDACGNILEMKHTATGGNWTRKYQYATDNNRLLAHSVPGDPDAGPYSAVFAYDSHGNMTRMPHLRELDWNFMDQLTRVNLNGGGEAFYTYGLSGLRIRKVIERQGGKRIERRYLGPLEIYWEFQGDTLTLERQTIHISDERERIAQVDIKTVDTGSAAGIGRLLIRYQYGNQNHSASLETDEHGALLTYEEYHVYGTTSYRSGTAAAEVGLKRYRFAGKERDEETGLYYFGARYYIPWLGRWASADPAGVMAGINLFAYAQNNPATLTDPSGLQTQEEIEQELHSAEGFESFEVVDYLEIGGAGFIIYEHPEFGTVYTKLTQVGEEPAFQTQTEVGGLTYNVSAYLTEEEIISADEFMNILQRASHEGQGSLEDLPGAGRGGGAPGGRGMAESGEVERDFFTRGGSVLLGGLVLLGIGILILLSGPVGWFAALTAAMAIAGGVAGTTMGATQLGMSYSGVTTAEQDAQLTDGADMAMALSSPGGLVGGLGGVAMTGDEEGLRTGAFFGGLAEGGLSLGYGATRMAYREYQFSRLYGTGSYSWRFSRRLKPAIRQSYGLGPGAERRANPLFNWMGQEVEFMELSHFFSQRATRNYPHIFNRPWNLKPMWGTEHALVDPFRWNFMSRSFKSAYQGGQFTGIPRYLRLAPDWMLNVGFGAAMTGKAGITSSNEE